jgi:hypothetical protein
MRIDVHSLDSVEPFMTSLENRSVCLRFVFFWLDIWATETETAWVAIE